MSPAATPPLRVAVAMNGGVSLAVWIGGVAHELDRFARRRGPWQQVAGAAEVSIDVFAGTSAGGLNAAFLAVAQRYGVELGPLRELWLDAGGLEPPPSAPDAKALLRSPRAATDSLLDGDLFRDRLADAFAALLAGQASPHGDDDRKRLDLRLTTTSLEGVERDLHDDLGSVVAERRHRTAFHFVDGAAARGHTTSDLCFESDAARQALVADLARAARSTASFPFAFAPSRCTGSEGDRLDPAMPAHQLLDGGVLDNLPVDEAIEAIFAMPADGPVARWLVAVVPDPSTPVDPADDTGPAVAPEADPTVTEVVLASVMGIPRTQAVGNFIEDVRAQNAVVAGRTAARRALLDRGLDSLERAARTTWATYKTSRTTALARQLAEELGVLDFAEVLAHLRSAPALPYFPSSFGATSGGWGSSVLRRFVSLLLGLHTEAGAPAELRDRIHRLRDLADAISPAGSPDGPPVADWRASVDRELATWPAAVTAGPAKVDALRQSLAALADYAAGFLVEIATGWSNGDPPLALAAVRDAGGADEQRLAAYRLLVSVEVLQGAFADFERGPEQVVKLGLLTPYRAAPLDPLGRVGTAAKLAGDELGHFGAFLKRSWRANDWMWGRIDASSFIFALLARARAPVPADEQLAVQRAIVREEAPVVCAAVAADVAAGARSVHGRALLGGADDLAPDLDATTVFDRIGIPATGDREAAFLGRCRIGEEHIADEVGTALVARVGTQALASTLSVARRAGLPMQSLVGKVLAPLRGVAVVAARYAATVRPPASGSRISWKAAVAARVGTAGLGALAVLDLTGVPFGVLRPWIWTALAAALLTLLLAAPLTTVLTIVGVAGAGFATAVPPGWHLDHLPIDRWRGIVVIAAALTIISLTVVDDVDRRLRGVVARAAETLRAMEAALAGAGSTGRATVGLGVLAAALPLGKAAQLHHWFGWPRSDLSRQTVLLLVAGAALAAVGSGWRGLFGWQVAFPRPASLGGPRAGRAAVAVAGGAAVGLAVVAATEGWATGLVVGGTVVGLALVVGLGIVEWRRKPAGDRALLWAVAPATVWWSALVLQALVRGEPLHPEHLRAATAGGVWGVLVVIALGEELLYRGFLLVLSARAQLGWVGVAVLSLSFGLWHVPDEWSAGAPAAVTTAVAMTLASAFVLVPLRLRCRSLAGPVLLHAANNIALLLLTAT